VPQQSSKSSGETRDKSAEPDVIDILSSPPEPTSTPSPPPVPDIKIPPFTSCSIKELEDRIHELRKLKASKDQSQLIALLDKTGAKIVDIARRTPNLVSDESVTTDQDGIKGYRNYSFLVLSHAINSDSVVLDEFRIDAKSGEKFQTGALQAAAQNGAESGNLPPKQLPSGRLPSTGGPPSSQGFASMWVTFYPANRRQSDFRLLGEQKIGRHHTLVLAFAQKPGLVPFPTTVSYNEKLYKLYVQGVAWVDATDFSIVRLHTDILAPSAGLPLRQLSTEIDFANVRVAEIASPLWLPRQVIVTSDVAGSRTQENHSYSNYRLFRTKSKMVLK